MKRIPIRIILALILQSFWNGGLSASSEICRTDDCRATATTFRNSINYSVDPCDDFYAYACGTWMKKNPIAPSESRRTQFNTVADRLTENVLEILTNPVSPDDSEPLVKAKTFYATCMDTDAMNDRGLKPLEDLIQEYGGWPLIDESTSSDDRNIENLLARLIRDYGFSALVGVTSDIDMKNTSRRVITLDQPSFFLARDFLVQPENYADRIKAYSTFMRDVILLLSPSKGEDLNVLEKTVDKILKFEMKLAGAASSAEDRRNMTALYHPFMLGQFQAYLDEEPVSGDHARIDFHRLLSEIWDGEAEILEQEHLIVLEPNYFRALRVVLDETAEETILNYVYWRWIANLIEETTDEMRNVGFSFAKAMSGVQEPKNRTKICTNFNLGAVYHSLGFAVGSEYIKKYFTPDHKKAVNDLVQYIQQAFAELMEPVDWMDAATKLEARNKLDNIDRHLAYSDWLVNSSAVDVYYCELKVEDDLHFENHVGLVRWEVRKYLQKLRKEVKRTDNDFHPLFVNAFYDPQFNSISFPAAILSSPFFQANGAPAVNFGAIGVVIGHEITHGFDDQGSQYDKYGRLENWWDEKTMERFNNKTHCFIDQYSRFHTPVGNISGRLTCGENIADNGGLRQAYLSHRNWLQTKGGENSLIEGLEDFSPDQLFFLGFANVWCQNVNPQLAQQMLKVDPHSPGKYRVLGTLHNSAEFSQAWNCSKSSAMNPENKCVLW